MILWSKRLLPAALLLLVVSGCNDVPIDTATFRSDTLTEPVFTGNKPGDTIVPTYSSVLPVINWRTLTLVYDREDRNSPGGSRKEALIVATSPETRVELKAAPGGIGESLMIDLTCVLPRRVRDSSVSPGSDLRTNLKQFDIVIPEIRVPGNPDGWKIPLENPPYESERPGASITLARPINGSYVFTTSQDKDSHGEFIVSKIDRRRRIIHAHVELRFRLKQGGPGSSRDLPLEMDLTLSY